MKNKFEIFKYILLVLVIGILGFGCACNFEQSAHVAYAKSIIEAKYQLEEPSQHLYTSLSDYIKQISAGIINQPTLEIDNTTLEEWNVKTYYTAAEIGQESIDIKDISSSFINQFNMANILSALLNDFPFDLYWFDKTVGISENLQAHTTTSYVQITNLEISFAVSENYLDSSSTQTKQIISSTKVEQAQTALDNAKQIVAEYADLSDYQKLVAYKNKICELVEYNKDAADNNYNYGDPWQIVYVFDNDSSTNVVCEGYAKAFQLLCNLSTFNSQYVSCYSVTGNMTGATGAGGHMWNIVVMDDESSYLVDVTNSDEDSIGQGGQLFLTGTTTGNIQSGYVFSCSSAVTFTYDTQMLSLWGTQLQSILNIASHDYSAEHPQIILSNVDNIIYNKKSLCAGLIETENIDISYTFDQEKWNAKQYNWTHQWHADNNNHIGEMLLSDPHSAGYYWIKITATNKIDSSIVYTHNQRIQIKPKQLTIVSVIALDKTYDANATVVLSEINLAGVISGDTVSLLSVTAQTPSENAGTYSSVQLSNLTIQGEDKNNYTISESISNVSANSITIAKATPTCNPVFSPIDTNDVLLKQVELSVDAKGVLGETINGTYVWANDQGESIDISSMEITKDTKYYYIFTPNDTNYSATLAEVVLWPSQNDKFNIKDLFTPENLPKTIEYAVYGFVTIVVLISIGAVTKKKRLKV